MKLFAFLTFFFLNGLAFSQPEDFETRKKRVLQNQKDRIARIQESLSCFQSTEDEEGLNKCRTQEREKMDAFHNKMEGLHQKQQAKMKDHIKLKAKEECEKRKRKNRKKVINLETCQERFMAKHEKRNKERRHKQRRKRQED